MRTRWVVVIFALCAAAAGLLSFNLYRQHELSQTIAERGRAAAEQVGQGVELVDQGSDFGRRGLFEATFAQAGRHGQE